MLAQNSGLDPQEAIVKLQEEYTGPSQAVGLDIKTGKRQRNCDHGLFCLYNTGKGCFMFLSNELKYMYIVLKVLSRNIF